MYGNSQTINRSTSYGMYTIQTKSVRHHLTCVHLSLTFPVLADPNTEIVREYGMYSRQMRMPDMGYTVIDKQGRIQTQVVDQQFGENVNAIARALRRAKSAT